MRAIINIIGKKYLLDTSLDEKIFDAGLACYRRTGAANADRGTNLFAHFPKIKRGEEKQERQFIFYFYHWSRIPGETSHIQPITHAQAKEFVEENIDYFTASDQLQMLNKLTLWSPEEME